MITCRICKKSFLESKIKETIKLCKNGQYMVKGGCPVCKRFVKWISHKESKYTQLYRIENERISHL